MAQSMALLAACVAVACALLSGSARASLIFYSQYGPASCPAESLLFFEEMTSQKDDGPGCHNSSKLSSSRPEFMYKFVNGTGAGTDYDAFWAGKPHITKTVYTGDSCDSAPKTRIRAKSGKGYPDTSFFAQKTTTDGYVCNCDECSFTYFRDGQAVGTESLNTCISDGSNFNDAVCSECPTCEPDAGTMLAPGALLPLAAVSALLWSQLL
jgi:hypothetical protein